MIKYTRTLTVMVDEEKFKEWTGEMGEPCSNDIREEVIEVLDYSTDDDLLLGRDFREIIASVDEEAKAEIVK